MLKVHEIKRKPRIIFDMDDVLAEYLPELINRFNLVTGQKRKVSEVTDWNLVDIFGNAIIPLFNSKGIFRNLKPKGNLLLIKELLDSEKYDIFIVTACPFESIIEKAEWIKEFMPFFPLNRLIPACEKSAIWGDIILDDSIYNCREFSKTVGEAVIFDMPHNKKYRDEFIRVTSLEEFIEHIEKKFNFQNDKKGVVA